MTSAATDAALCTIRRAVPGDASAIARLSGELGYPASVPQMDARLAAILPRADHAIWIAELAQPRTAPRIIGWGHGYVSLMLETDPRVELAGLVVEEEQRSRGAGARLLAAIEAWATELGCATVSVRSNVLRTRAHVFYERHEYIRIKSQHAFLKALKEPPPPR